MKKLNLTHVKMMLMSCLLMWSVTTTAQLVDSTVPSLHWARNWGQQAAAEKIGTDGQGNVVAAGFLPYAADFDPGPDEYILTPGMEGLAQNAYITKLDSAGNFIWAKKIEPDPNTPAVFDMYSVMGIQSLAVSKRGNIYLAGNFFGALDLDPGPDVFMVEPTNDVEAFGEWWPSMFIVKLDANGDFQWGGKIDNYNGSQMNLAVFEENDIEELYITGNYDQLTTAESSYTITLAIDYDMGPGEYLVGGDSLLYRNSYGYLMKYSGNGEFQWFKRIARGVSPGLGTYTVSVPAIDNDRNIYVAGHFWGNMDADPSNETYFVSSVDTLPSEATTSGVTRELFVAKYDAEGALVWFRYSDAQPMVDVGMYYYPEVWSASVAIDAESNVYVAPVFRGNINLDREQPVGGDASFETYFNPFPQMGQYLPNYAASAIMKYNSSGDFQWAKLLPNSANSGVKVDKIVVSPPGEVYIHGEYRSSVDFDPGVDTHMVYGSDVVGAINAMPYRFLAKYDSAGNYLWADRIHRPVSPSDSLAAEYVYDMVLDDEGNLIYGGRVSDQVGMDVDPGEGIFTLTSLEGDGYLVKLGMTTTYTDTTTVDTTTSVHSFAQIIDLKVYPNPNQGQLQVKSSKSLHNATLLLFDLTGRLVLEQTNLNGTDFSCDLSALPGGSYILRVTEGTSSASYKLVKQE